MYVNDPQFGHIVDYDDLRKNMRKVYDASYPKWNMIAAAKTAIALSKGDPSYAISMGASGLAYSILIAAEEHEMASTLKDYIFTLGWTEEHSGSDLLSIRTKATPVSDDPNERQYHIKGTKWIINCSYHADYHVVLAKLDPDQDGPRSLSFFLVPRSSVKKWTRIETHVLTRMVLTEFEIDGPGTLVGKIGHGLSILQRMAMPSKYQCSCIGIAMIQDSVPATLAHLNRKRIFGNNPIRFSNVFRQMYDVVLKSALYDFMFHRAVTFNTNGFLQFHGTLIKSYLLLRINEVLMKNLLVAGSIGFTKGSLIGQNAFDSAILPVFDGHYTINTLMSAKHFDRYLNGQEKANLAERVEQLRTELYVGEPHDEINETAKSIRKPPFFDLVDYLNQAEIPFEFEPAELVQQVIGLVDEIEDRGLSSDPEYRYKTGDLQHWIESIVAAIELWKLLGDDYVNTIAIQYNGFVNVFNEIVSEGGLTTNFISPVRQKPIPEGIEDDPAAYLSRILDVQGQIVGALQQG